jgi:putative transposase
MIDILALLQCLAPYTTPTTLRQMSRILSAILTMSGRVTMLGISRWAGKGGSYRTVQRFFYTVLPWAMMFWLFFRQHLFNPGDVYLLAGDECVVPKAGKRTYGLDRFFSSLYGRPVPATAFFALSLISMQKRQSYPIQVEQMVRSVAKKTTAKTKAKGRKQQKKKAAKRPVGRPKGSKNRDKTQVTLTLELQLIKTMIQKLLLLLNGCFTLTYLVLDGHFGNNNALQMARHCGLHLISKLRRDVALYLPYHGPYSGHGPRRKYGDKIDYGNIPNKYLQQTTVEKNIQTDIYQARMLHKEFAQALNVVIIVKTNLDTQAQAYVILFSSDLDLPYDKLIDYYSLRFQIEFNFRDAKQYWGLDDFMNIKPTAVTNAANLSLFMVNVAHRLLRDFRQQNPHYGVLDLKTHCRGHKYATETLKLLPQMPEPILLAQIYDRITRLGGVHTAKPVFSSP